jgi:hypothetical protein
MTRTAAKTHPLQCRCGTLRGQISDPDRVNRVVCYCRDCQAFAYFLGNPQTTLDALGGSDVVQTIPARVTFTQGTDSLACMRLSPRGLLRWYAQCCRTPIGNTVANHRFSFVGLLHDCLEHGDRSLDVAFGPVRMWNSEKSARGPVTMPRGSFAAGLARFAGLVLRARLDGSYRRTPFFVTTTGEPVVIPRILTQSEREGLLPVELRMAGS